MDTPKPVDVDARETLVGAARRFMADHPEVLAVGLTVASNVIDPRALSTTIVGRDGPIITPDRWALCALRLLEAAQYCIDQTKGLMLGLDELARTLARDVERLRDERADLAGGKGDHGR
jgi:hypothetical protein